MKINIDEVIMYRNAYEATCRDIKRNNGVCNSSRCKKELCPFCYAECEEELNNVYILQVANKYLDLFCSNSNTFYVGEEVEVQLLKNSPFENAKMGVVFTDGRTSIDPELIRKVPDWEPKDGEPVLFNDDGRAMAGFIKDGILYARGLMVADWKTSKEISKFTNNKDVGKPWKDILVNNFNDNDRSTYNKLQKAIRVLESLANGKERTLDGAEYEAAMVLKEIR
jgi:hypothetical protein